MAKVGRTAALLALVAAAGAAAACGSEGTGPDKGTLALSGGDSSGGGGSAPPPPPPPPTCEPGSLALLDGTVLGWSGPGTDSTKAPPVRDVTVRVERFMGDSINGSAHFELVATETTNSAGKFQVEDLQIALYRVTFRPPADSPYRQTESVTYVGSCARLALNYFLLRK